MLTLTTQRPQFRFSLLKIKFSVWQCQVLKKLQDAAMTPDVRLRCYINLCFIFFLYMKSLLLFTFFLLFLLRLHLRLMKYFQIWSSISKDRERQVWSVWLKRVGTCCSREKHNRFENRRKLLFLFLSPFSILSCSFFLLSRILFPFHSFVARQFAEMRNCRNLYFVKEATSMWN